MGNMNGEKKVLKERCLHNPKLRKIRYNLRTILYLEYRKRMESFMDDRKEVNTALESEKISSQIWHKKITNIQNRECLFRGMTLKYPAMGCFACKSRLNDLEFREDCHWYCHNSQHDVDKRGLSKKTNPFNE